MQSNTRVEPTHLSDDLDVLRAYDEVFSGEVCRFEGQLKLEVDASVRPVQLPVRKAPVSVRPRLKAELDRLEKLKVIAPVTDPTGVKSSYCQQAKR